MKRWLLLLPLLATACSDPMGTITLSGYVELPIASVSAFPINGTPILVSNFDGNLGKINAATLDQTGRFAFRIERSSLPESPQWFKLVVLHPTMNGPMLSRALVLSRNSENAEKLVLSPYSSLTQMAIEYQYQLDASLVPTTLSPSALEDTFASRGDAFLLDSQFHLTYGNYASGSTKVPPAADTQLASYARDLLFTTP